MVFVASFVNWRNFIWTPHSRVSSNLCHFDIAKHFDIAQRMTTVSLRVKATATTTPGPLHVHALIKLHLSSHPTRRHASTHARANAHPLPPHT